MHIDTTEALKLLHKAIASLPETVTLSGVDCDDELTDEQIALILDGQVDRAREKIDDWAMDAQGHVIDACLAEALPDDLERAYLKASDVYPQFEEACRDRDDSEPFKELLENTDRKMVRLYLCPNGDDLDMGQESWRWDDKQVEKAARHLARLARIRFKDNREALREIVENATYGGKLCVLWQADVEELFKAIEHTLKDDGKGRVRITFTDPMLLMYDGFNGSGHNARVKGQVVMEFGKEEVTGSRRLFGLDAKNCGHGYSWSDDIAQVVHSYYKSDPKIELLAAGPPATPETEEP